MASRLHGALSPLPQTSSRSGASSPPRRRHCEDYESLCLLFPDDQLRPFIRTILTKSLTGATWDSTDKAKMSGYSKDISDRVKQRMIEIEPRGFKYIVTTTLSENLGQAGRADMSCHWEDTDGAIQEIFSNDSIILVCVAFAVRVV